MEKIYIIITAAIIFIYFYFIITYFFAARKYNYLQETSVAILIGVIVGIFIFFFTQFFQSQSEGLDTLKTFIFLVLLPPIMFEDGYNFPKRKFFQNILYINLYGILGTIFNFFAIYFIIYGFNYGGYIVSVSDANESIYLFNWQMLLMAACLCSIEPIVSEKVINKQRHPKLFSVIFGQSLFKDTIALTLFDSINQIVSNLDDQNVPISGSQVGFIIGRFIVVVICSILIGIIVGVFTTFIFKNFRFLLGQKGISEIALTMLTGYLCYIISEWLQFSGVISMLFCGTVLSHFNIYNMSHEGNQATKMTIIVLKVLSTGVIFFLMGFQVFNVNTFVSDLDGLSKSSFSASLLGITFFAIFIGRALNIFFSSLLGYFIVGKSSWRINCYQYFIIYVAGMVKGVVPFALILTIPQTSPATTSNTAQANIVCVVLITSFIFTLFIPKIQKMLLKKINELRTIDPAHPSLKDSLLAADPDSIVPKLKKHNSQNAAFFTKFKSSTQKYWHKLNEGILKPFLIYDYYQRKQSIKLQKIKHRKQEHEQYMKRYGNFAQQNILNLDNEAQNKFIDVQLSQNSSSDDESEAGVVKIKKKDLQMRTSKYAEQQIVTYQKKQAEDKLRRSAQIEIKIIQSGKQSQKNKQNSVKSE